MLKKHDGYLLLESLLAMFVLVIGILFMFETLVFLRKQEIKSQDKLELAIFSKEWHQITEKSDKKELLDKATKQQIIIKESGNDIFLLEKNGTELEIKLK